MRWLPVLAVIIGALPAVAAAQAPACGFQLGFKAIADQIPAEVGECLENEHFNTSNGNAEQRTRAHHGQGGLLVWRKADNWTAYTDGHWTWVNGPNGLQRRLNDERFAFEAPAAAPAPAPAPPAPPVAVASRGVPPATGGTCPTSHPIKGNQGSRSTTDWIYHPPGSRSYAVTNPEECFATAADAQAAGYRAPQN